MTAGIQPKGATNNGNLFIPNKQQMIAYDAVKYGTDMRAIEKWCNSLISETNITLGSIILQQPFYQEDGGGDFIFVPGSGGTSPSGGAPLDTTNLTYGPMTVPPSGLIRAEISFCFGYLSPTTDAPHSLYIGLSEHGTPSHVYDPIELIDEESDNFASSVRGSYSGRRAYDAILSLTPGDTVQFDLWGETAGTPGNPSGYVLFTDTGTGFQTYTGPILATFYEA